MNYFRRLIDSNDPASVKRFTIIIALALYTMTNVMALFINKTFINSEILKIFVEFNFYIIAIGVFGLSVDKIGDVLLERAKAFAAAQILGPQPTVTQVENVQGDINGSPEEIPKEEKTDVNLTEMKSNITKSLKSKPITPD